MCGAGQAGSSGLWRPVSEIGSHDAAAGQAYFGDMTDTNSLSVVKFTSRKGRDGLGASGVGLWQQGDSIQRKITPWPGL